MRKKVFENGTREVLFTIINSLVHHECFHCFTLSFWTSSGIFSHYYEYETLTSHMVREKWSDRMMGMECEHSSSIDAKLFWTCFWISHSVTRTKMRDYLYENEYTIIWVCLRKSLDFLFFSHIVSLYFLPLCRIQNSSSLLLSESYLLSVSGSS